jgi:hypothetical protein
VRKPSATQTKPLCPLSCVHSKMELAFPTDHNTTLEVLHWARMAAKEDAQTITILIINHKDWTPQQLPVTNPDIHILATIPSHTIQYNPTP